MTSLLLTAALTLQAPDINQALAGIADQLFPKTTAQSAVSVGVMDFSDLDGNTSALGRYLAERVTTALTVVPGATLVPRAQVMNAVNQLGGASVLGDPQRLQKLADLLRVDLLVAGVVTDLGTDISIDARVIQLRTNRIVRGASASFQKTEQFAKMLKDTPPAPKPSGGFLSSLAREITRGLSDAGQNASTGSRNASTTSGTGVIVRNQVVGASGYQGNPMVQVTLETIQRDPKGVLFTLVVANNDKYGAISYVMLHDLKNNTTLRDDKGRNYRLVRYDGLPEDAGQSTSRPIADYPQEAQLQPGARKRVELVFDPIQSNAETILFTTGFKVSQCLTLPLGECLSTSERVVPVQVLDIQVKDFKQQ